MAIAVQLDAARIGPPGSGTMQGNSREPMTPDESPLAEEAAPAPAAAAVQPAPAKKARTAPPRREPHPLLHKLADWHPALFGARFRPLKLGIFEDLLARHGSEVDKDALKAALSFHARSTLYLESVAAGDKRHDLDGNPVEDVAPEHRHHAIMEVFRRRQARMRQDLKPWLQDRLVQAIEASGLERDAYLERVRTQDPFALEALQVAFDALAERSAKREAVRRAYQASGRSVSEFAQMYGLDEAVVREAVR
jgi:ProP effector